MNIGKQLKEGFVTQNPVLVQLLGMCSTLAITTTIANGIGMGASVTIILTLSNIFISLLRRVIPQQVRIAAYIVVIAGFVTMVDLLLQAFFPDIAESLGVFIPSSWSTASSWPGRSPSPARTSPWPRPWTASARAWAIRWCCWS